MIGDGALTFREFVMREPHPLATIQDAILEFLRGRRDVVLFGAQAVNAYVEEPRMTQDVDVASTRGLALAEELQQFLNERFHIAVRVRDVREGLGYRIYQVRKEGNRHLVDVRPVKTLPPSQVIAGVQVVTPPDLIAGKLLASVGRRGKPKAFTDQRDLAMLLLRFPELKTLTGPVRDRLVANGAEQAVLAAWEELVAQEILPEEDEDEFGG
jgi:hypothetical protein